MSPFNYGSEAELFPTRSRLSRRQPVTYKRFDTAAEAIRYAIEELDPDLLVGAYLEVDEERFDAQGIRKLYASDDFPLSRDSRRASSRDSAKTTASGRPPTPAEPRKSRK